MTLNKSDDSETVPLVDGNIQDVYPLFQADPVQEEYLSPIVRAWQAFSFSSIIQTLFLRTRLYL